jgi:hypothetical protein
VYRITTDAIEVIVVGPRNVIYVDLERNRRGC